MDVELCQSALLRTSMASAGFGGIALNSESVKSILGYAGKFVIRTRGIIVALLITGTLSSGQPLAQAPAAAEAVAKVLGAAGAGELISKIFDKLTTDKTPEEKAREPLRAFYQSLILLRNTRADLYQAILDRLSDPAADKADYSHVKSDYWPQSYIRVKKAASDAGVALGYLKKSALRENL